MQAPRLGAELERVLSADLGEVVIPLVVLANDHGGRKSRVAQTGEAGDGDVRQAGRQDVPLNIGARNPDLLRDILAKVQRERSEIQP